MNSTSASPINPNRPLYMVAELLATDEVVAPFWPVDGGGVVAGPVWVVAIVPADVDVAREPVGVLAIVVWGKILADAQVASRMLVPASKPDRSVPQDAPIQAAMPAA